MACCDGSPAGGVGGGPPRWADGMAEPPPGSVSPLVAGDCSGAVVCRKRLWAVNNVMCFLELFFFFNWKKF